MIKTKKDLYRCLEEDKKWYADNPIRWTERFKCSERWHVWQVIVNCRREEYHTNNMKGSLYHKIMRLYYSTKGRRYYFKYGISIQPNTIGPGLYIPHMGHIMISSFATIGRNFIVRSGCTIGLVKGDKQKNAAIIGDNVELSLGVKMFGNVKIGRGALINANSVIVENIPPYAIACGNPAKVIGFRHSPSEIVEIEKKYPENERIPTEILEKNYRKYFLDRISEIKNFLKV